MADASDSKSDEGDFVWVQVPLPARKNRGYPRFFFDHYCVYVLRNNAMKWLILLHYTCFYKITTRIY